MIRLGEGAALVVPKHDALELWGQMISPPRPVLAGTDLDRGAWIFTRLFAVPLLHPQAKLS